MDINQSKIDQLFKAWNTQMIDAFKLRDARFDMGLGMMTNTLNTTSSIEEFPFFEQVGGMREWIGPRVAVNMASQKLQVQARTFERTMNVDIDKLADDRLGWYQLQIAAFGDGAAQLKNDLVKAALVYNSGVGAKWVDSVDFFATTRTYGDSAIVNKVASALSNTTFETAYLTMTSYKGHEGYPLRVTPTHLFVGPKNRTNAFNIIKNQFGYDGTDKVQRMNANQNLVEVVMLADLIGDYDDYWYLADCSGAIKPVIYGNRQAPTTQTISSPDSEYAKQNNALMYGVKARGEAALAMPHLIYGGIL